MQIKNLFRTLVILSLVIPICGGAYTYLTLESYSQDWQDLFTWNGDGAILGLNNNSSSLELVYDAFTSILIILILISTIGLLLFKRWARTLTVFIISISLLFSLILGLSVMTPIETFTYELSAYITGIFIAMAYLPPLNERFT